MEIVTGIIACILLIMLLVLLYSALRDGFYLLMHKAGLQRAFVTVAVRDRTAVWLQGHPYFSGLSEKGRKRFLDRLFTFMYNKEFKGADGFAVTEEMKVLISAAAVQLTFGLEKFGLANLETIIVFPGTFTLGGRKTEYKGATSPKGVMFLSWNAFREGNADPSDKVNLGLHEMAHALKLSLSLGTGFDSYFASRIDIWETMAGAEMEKLRSRAEEFLRPYGKTNMAEFFAVCAEAFFESPKEFSRQLPELYRYMVFLLHQDPANAPEDYRVPGDFLSADFNFSLPEKVNRSYKYNSWHWSLSLLLFGILGGFLSIGFFINHLVLPYIFYFAAPALIGTIGLLQMRYFETRSILKGAFFYFYSYMGFGLSISTLLFWINFFIPVTTQQEDRLTVKSFDPVWTYRSSRYSTSGGYEHFAGYALQTKESSWYTPSLLLVKDPPPAMPSVIAFRYHRGLLGIKVLEGYRYIPLR